MLARGGDKIYSIEVENALYAHPKILEAAVFGVPGEVFGEQVRGAVVLKPEREPPKRRSGIFASRDLQTTKSQGHFSS